MMATTLVRVEKWKVSAELLKKERKDWASSTFHHMARRSLLHHLSRILYVGQYGVVEIIFFDNVKQSSFMQAIFSGTY
jgi:hypothetical protein